MDPQQARPSAVAGPSSEPGSRLAGVDGLRLLALACIVIGHVYTTNDFVDRALQSWRLPLFFMITGYFWSNHRDFVQEVHKRTRSLLVPYTAWMIILAVGLFFVRAGDVHPGALARAVVLGGNYAGRPWTTLWFFTALAAAALIYRLLTATPQWVQLVVIMLGLVVNIAAGQLMARIPLSVGTAFGALAFLYVGQAVRRAQRSGSVWSRPWVAWLALAIAAAVVAVVPGDFLPMDMKKGEFPPLAVGLALVMCAALLSMTTSVRYISRGIGRVLSALALPSAVVIAAHPFVLLLLPPETTGVPLALVASIALFAPLILGLAIVRTPLSSVLAGVPRVRAGRQRHT